MAIINDKAALLGAVSRKEELVKVPVGEIRVIELGAIDYAVMCSDFAKEKQEKGDLDDRMFLLTVASWACVDDAGERLLTVDDFQTMNRKTQDALVAASFRLNFPAVDEKNAEAGLEEDSPSGSL
jgi:hypothetical protein